MAQDARWVAPLPFPPRLLRAPALILSSLTFPFINHTQCRSPSPLASVSLYLFLRIIVSPFPVNSHLVHLIFHCDMLSCPYT